MKKKQSLERFKNRSFTLFKRFKMKKIWSNFFLIIAFILFFHMVFSEKIVNPLRNCFISSEVFMRKKLDDVCGTISNLKYFFSTDINKIIFDLRKENLQLRHENENFEYIKSENKELRKILSMEEEYLNKIVVAKILTIFSNDYVRSCIVDAGSSSGIAINDILKNQNGLIGRIIKVNDNWSEALLITDTNSNIPVKIGENKINAIVSGDNSNRLRISMIHEDVSVNDKDLVETSGYGNVFREKIPVGNVMKKDGNYFVIPFVNFNQLKYVVIIKKQKLCTNT